MSAADTTHHSPTALTAAGVTDAILLLYSAMMGDRSADMSVAKAGLSIDQKEWADDRRCVSEALDRE